MPTDEKHKRRKRAKSSSIAPSSSHRGSRKHDSEVPPEPEPSEHPATVADLRQARLNYLATPPEERQRKMKYEFVKTVKVKEGAKFEPKKEDSAASKARPVTQSGDRATRSRSRATKNQIQEAEDEGQFVYGPPRGREQMPGAFEIVNHDREIRVESRKRKSKSSKSSRGIHNRRHSEPVIQQETTVTELCEPRSARPQLQTRVKTLPITPRIVQNDRSNSSLPGSYPKTTASDNVTVVSTSTSRRNGSIFGSLFGAKPPPAERKVSCLTCGDDVPIVQTANLPCTHRMCHSCLKRIFKLSVTDPAHMPPHCCTDQAISLKHVDSLFSHEFKENYNRKLKEYKAKNKIYCPARGCGEWIQPKYIKLDKGRKIGRCPACKTSVCGICSQKMHKARDCPKDPATKEFVETAKKAGWQKCYNCNAMVELKEGCNHMTCRCTAEFCMVCGLKWKSCDCPWFSYDQVDITGDPVRFQQEMDRRREQEQRDEAMARRVAALQVNEDRPVLAEWINLDAPGGRHLDPNFVQQARDALAANYNQGDRAARALLNGLFARQTAPAMPGGWDDGPQQYEQPPQRTRTRRVNFQDPAAMEQEGAEPVSNEGVRVVRHRSHRRRSTATAPNAFEARPVTAEEREQERRIRAWATGAPQQ